MQFEDTLPCIVRDTSQSFQHMGVSAILQCGDLERLGSRQDPMLDLWRAREARVWNTPSSERHGEHALKRFSK